jgi:hypothetical protein
MVALRHIGRVTPIAVTHWYFLSHYESVLSPFGFPSTSNGTM